MNLYDKNKYVRGLYHWIWYIRFNKTIIFWAGLGSVKIWLGIVVLTMIWDYMDLYDKNKYVRGLHHWIWYPEFNKRIIFWAGLGGVKIWLVEVT